LSDSTPRSRRGSAWPPLSGGLLWLAACAGLLTACASSGPAPAPPPPEPSGPPAAELTYLLPPVEGWSGGATAEQLDHLEAGHLAVRAGNLDAARAAVDALAAAGAPVDGYPPSAVLAAQADVLEGRWPLAVSRLRPHAEAHPAYAPLQLLLARSAEQAGQPIVSYAAFRRLAGDNLLAYDRASELLPRVAEILAHRVDDAVGRGDAAAAAAPLAKLREWAPEMAITWRSALAVAAAAGDRAGELEAIRGLSRVEPLAADVAERRGELELEIGDPMRGLQVFERLAAENPDDPRFAERVAYAKFRWRVTQMPPRVNAAASAPEVDRGNLAVLVYWLVPQVRSARASAGRIASDILEDPRREEIARVVNLGLMDVDAALHRFSPERTVDRRRAFSVMLRLIADHGGGACIEAAPEASAGGEEVCAAAIACGLVAADEVCEPAAPLSGPQAVETLRRAVVRLGATRGAP
jgi:hypothetical protein